MQKFSNQWITENTNTIIKWSLIVFFSLICVLFAVYSDYNLATGTGNLCIILFILGNTYVPAKWLRFKFGLKNVAESFSIFLDYHIYINIAAFVTCCVHCYVSHWVNFWLEVSLVLMGWLILGGFLMKYVYSPALKKGIYFLHTQQFVFILLLFALLKGHYVI
ncbi:MAG: hypothetical protein HQM16_12230 [Deltaproteobacteria bacterium]|nr:hypothetical protein [Deltaproteobacteria bacterium]